MPDYALMNQCLFEGKAQEVAEMTQAALDEGRSPQEVLAEGLIAGMSVVGEDFKYNILYVPEVLIAARAMKAGMAVLKPLLAAKEGEPSSTGVLMMGTVRGDLHDIGKNLVCMMAEGAGFQVHDIGVDQSVQKFMAAADKYSPDIIGMSALLTTTMNYMKTVIDGFEEDGRTGVKFAIGGAPISEMFADEIGADGYGKDASSAVDLFLYLMGHGEAPTNATVVREKKESPKDEPEAEQATYQVLYWRDIPSAVKAWDENGEVKVELSPRFAERIDIQALRLGLTDEDSYVAEYHWSDEVERAGSAEEVAAAVRDELEAESND